MSETPDLAGLLTRAILLLERELERIEPGDSGDLVRVLTELRHQVAALALLLKRQGAEQRLESAILATIRTVDERLWLEVSAQLEQLSDSTSALHNRQAEARGPGQSRSTHLPPS